MLCKANPTYMKIKIGNVEIVHALRKAHTHNTSTRTHTHRRRWRCLDICKTNLKLLLCDNDATPLQ